MSQAGSLPRALAGGLQRLGVPHGIARQIGFLPPVSSLFAAVLGVNPVQHLLAALLATSQRVLTGRQFLPDLTSGPFQHGLSVVFGVAAALAAVAALASLLRGGRYIHPAAADKVPPPAAGRPPHAAAPHARSQPSSGPR